MNSPDTHPTARLDDIRRRATKATPGPWKTMLDDWDDLHVVTVDSTPQDYAAIPQDPDDCEFIAHARTDIDALLAVVGAVHMEHDGRNQFNTCAICGALAPLLAEDGEAR